MRIGRVIGKVTLSRQLPDVRPGAWLIVDALDGPALATVSQGTRRQSAMPESLVVYDELGAGVGQLVAVSEGREACMPWYPVPVPIDAYCAAILDNVELTQRGA